MIIGCCGAGKSTLARQLSAKTGLPLIHLDQHYWQENWVETEKSAWEKIARKLAEGDKWIIDGNYGGTIDIRLKRADTVIYIDLSTLRCLGRILKRTFNYYGTERPDMPKGCKERFSLSFIHYVATFNLLRRKNLLAKINTYASSKNIYVLRNESEIQHVIASISNSNS